MNWRIGLDIARGRARWLGRAFCATLTPNGMAAARLLERSASAFPELASTMRPRGAAGHGQRMCDGSCRKPLRRDRKGHATSRGRRVRRGVPTRNFWRRSGAWHRAAVGRRFRRSPRRGPRPRPRCFAATWTCIACNGVIGPACVWNQRRPRRRSPFRDRCALLLDPAMMEQARRAAADFEREILRRAAKTFGQMGRQLGRTHAFASKAPRRPRTKVAAGRSRVARIRAPKPQKQIGDAPPGEVNASEEEIRGPKETQARRSPQDFTAMSSPLRCRQFLLLERTSQSTSARPGWVSSSFLLFWNGTHTSRWRRRKASVILRPDDRSFLPGAARADPAGAL